MSIPRRYSLLLLLVASAIHTQAQEPAYMEAATHPGRHQLYTRYRLTHEQSEIDNLNTKRTTLALKTAFGLKPTLAVLLDADLAFRSASNLPDEQGLETITLRLKQRFLQIDPEPLNTIRASFTAGIRIPGTNHAIAPDDPAASLGATITAILGRHGLNAQLNWTGGGDDRDLYEFNLSHLYRLAPAVYAINTKGAWYTMLELINQWDENGDGYTQIAPGILYEARRWAAEIAAAFTLAEEGPREHKLNITTGFRWLF